MLRRADPVRVDRLDVIRVGLPAPAKKELLGRRLASRHDVVRRRLAAFREGGRARHDPHHLRGQPAEVGARLLVVDVDELLELPLAREMRDLGLEICGRVPGQALRHVRLGIGHLRVEVVVDEQPPDVLVGVPPDEVLDVDSRGNGARRLPDRGRRSAVSTATTPSSPGLKSFIAPKSIGRVAAAWRTR